MQGALSRKQHVYFPESTPVHPVKDIVSGTLVSKRESRHNSQLHLLEGLDLTTSMHRNTTSAAWAFSGLDHPVHLSC